jgi:hypothetical protein
MGRINDHGEILRDEEPRPLPKRRKAASGKDEFGWRDLGDVLMVYLFAVLVPLLLWGLALLMVR